MQLQQLCHTECFTKPFTVKQKHIQKKRGLEQQSDVGTHKRTVWAKGCTQFSLTLTGVLLFAMTQIHIHFSMKVIKIRNQKKQCSSKDVHTHAHTHSDEHHVAKWSDEISPLSHKLHLVIELRGKTPTMRVIWSNQICIYKFFQTPTHQNALQLYNQSNAVTGFNATKTTLQRCKCRFI